MAKKRNTAAVLKILALFGLANLDPPHSSAQFSVRHLGISTVRGTFNKVGGVVVDSPDPSKASVNVTIDANSIDTRVEMRDKDLRSDHTSSMLPSIRRLPSYRNAWRQPVQAS
jgi:polyisoprenoid-binding protein YceI